MSYPIDDKEMLKEIETDLVNAHDFTEEKAKRVAPLVANYVVDKMWDEYSEALSYSIEKYIDE